jgi:hypothetical protein
MRHVLERGKKEEKESAWAFYICDCRNIPSIEGVYFNITPTTKVYFKYFHNKF